MKCMILAAGYATRLYPLTENFPKPLLKVQGKTILDWLIDDIETLHAVDEYIVISNHKFAGHFQDWASEKQVKITVLDDGTTSNENRLGAVRDVEFALKELAVEDDVLMIAGDNLLDFSLTKFIRYAEEKGTSCIVRYYEPDEKKLHKSGIVQIDENDLIIGMAEKPEHPASNWVTPPFYFYRKEDILRVSEALQDGCGADAPGSFPAWLFTRTAVHAMEMPGRRYDIGDLQSYELVQKEYKGIAE